VAENSGGLRCFKYGVTEDYLLGLEVVLPNGAVLTTGGKAKKDVAGYNLKKLFVSSEGTLGIVTKILVRLIPKPPAIATLLAFFDSLVRAGEAVTAMVAKGIIPTTLEFLDNVVINCVEDHARLGLPRDKAALLLIQVDGHPVQVEEEAEAVEKICSEYGAASVSRALTLEEGEQLAQARRMALSSLARVSPTTILEDATVPRSELATMIEFIQTTATKYNVRVGVFGHVGDGNLHPTFLTDERNQEEMKRVHEASREIFEKAVELGGTITGEHGVGYAKREFLAGMVGSLSIDLMRKVKAAFDPKGLMNPGKIFETEPVSATRL
jgi:glycolate oxidase